MNETLFSLRDIALRLNTQHYKIQYLLSTGAAQEPALRVAGKRLWNQAEIDALSEVLQSQAAKKLRRQMENG